LRPEADYCGNFVDKEPKLELSFCAHNFGNDFDNVKAGLKGIKEIGYEGTEFWQQFLLQTDVEKLADVTREIGLKVVQICGYFKWTGTDEEWEESNGNAERLIGFSKKLGGPHIRVFTGKVGSEEATQEQWMNCVEGLRRACAAAAPEGICFTLENHRNVLHDTPDSALRLIKDVGCENLGLNFQMWPPFDMVETARKVFPHVFHMHISNRKDGKIWQIDDGEVDWRPVLLEMKKLGYKRFASVEHAVQPAIDFAKRAYDYLAPIVYGENDATGGKN